MAFLCGLTGLVSNEMFQFVLSKLTGSFGHDVMAAVKCLYEGKLTCLSQSTLPIELNMNGNILLHCDCLCISRVLSCCPIAMLDMYGCHIGDTGAELLVQDCPYKSISQLLEVLHLSYNNLTIKGVMHIVKILKTSSHDCCHYYLHVATFLYYKFRWCLIMSAKC